MQILSDQQMTTKNEWYEFHKLERSQVVVKIALVVEWLAHIPDKNEKKVQFLPRVPRP